MILRSKQFINWLDILQHLDLFLKLQDIVPYLVNPIGKTLLLIPLQFPYPFTGLLSITAGKSLRSLKPVTVLLNRIIQILQDLIPRSFTSSSRDFFRLSFRLFLSKKLTLRQQGYQMTAVKINAANARTQTIAA